MKEVFLKFYKSAVEAELMQGVLKSEGIPSILRRRGMEQRIGYPDNDGADLFVLENMLVRAEEVLGAFENAG
jgi:hypothetical protein